MKENALTPEERQILVDAKIKDAKEMIEVAKMNYQFGFYNSSINRLY